MTQIASSTPTIPGRFLQESCTWHRDLPTIGRRPQRNQGRRVLGLEQVTSLGPTSSAFSASIHLVETPLLSTSKLTTLGITSEHQTSSSKSLQLQFLSSISSVVQSSSFFIVSSHLNTAACLIVSYLLPRWLHIFSPLLLTSFF